MARAAVPIAYQADFRRALRMGLDPDVAEALIAGERGLMPADDQKARWTLRELADLEFVRWRHQHGKA